MNPGPALSCDRTQAPCDDKDISLYFGTTSPFLVSHSIKHSTMSMARSALLFRSRELGLQRRLFANQTGKLLSGQ